MRNAFIESLTEEAKKDSKIVLITGDLGFGVLEKFERELPNQYFNFGIAEQSMMSAAAGMALNGLRPFVYSIANFPTLRCFEQIRNDVVYMNAPVCIVALGAGFAYGTGGYSHHLVEDISAMRSFEGLDIYSPHDPSDTKVSVNMIIKNSKPTYLRLGRGGEPSIVEEIEDNKIQGFKHLRKGRFGTIISIGSISSEAILASDLLRAQGHEPNIVSVTLLNEETILQSLDIHKAGPILTIEEHVIRGGFGSLVMETLIGTRFQAFPISIHGITKWNHKSSGNQDFLRAAYSLDSKSVAKEFLRLLEQK
jgi:transketolase